MCWLIWKIWRIPTCESRSAVVEPASARPEAVASFCQLLCVVGWFGEFGESYIFISVGGRRTGFCQLEKVQYLFMSAYIYVGRFGEFGESYITGTNLHRRSEAQEIASSICFLSASMRCWLIWRIRIIVHVNLARRS